MAEQLSVAVGRPAARAILIDNVARLVLIKRIKPGQAPYWTAPGGVETPDASVEAAPHRELFLWSWAKSRRTMARTQWGQALQSGFIGLMPREVLSLRPR